MEIDIIVDHDRVTIAGQVVMKPAHIGSSFWMEFWDAVYDLGEEEDEPEDI